MQLDELAGVSTITVDMAHPECLVISPTEAPPPRVILPAKGVHRFLPTFVVPSGLRVDMTPFPRMSETSPDDESLDDDGDLDDDSDPLDGIDDGDEDDDDLDNEDEDEDEECEHGVSPDEDCPECDGDEDLDDLDDDVEYDDEIEQDDHL
jgi:hypothetical protein